MTLAFAAAVGVLFGAGTVLLLKPDLLRVVVGIVLVANAANLALIGSGLTRGQAPIRPLAGTPSDPLVQAMTITAIVIGFGVAALLLSLVYRIYVSMHTVDLDELSNTEASRDRAQQRDEVSV